MGADVSDFDRELGVTRDPDVSSRKTIYPLDTFQDRNNVCDGPRYWIAGQIFSIWPPERAPGTYRLHYIPVPPRLVDGGTLPTELEKYREYIVAYMARKALMKRKQDTTDIDKTLGRLTARIAVATNNRRAEPRKIPMPSGERSSSWRKWPCG